MAGLLLSAAPLDAQRYPVRSFSREDGLSSAQVLSVAEGPRGYLWIGSNGSGVTRYDGHRFVPFRGDSLLPNGDVEAVEADPHGDLWFGTHDGLARYDGASFRSWRRDAGRGTDLITSLAADSGGVWVGTANGLARHEDGAFVEAPATEPLDGERVWAVEYDPEGRLWIGTDGGAYRLAGSQLEDLSGSPGLPDSGVRGLLRDAGGRMWVGTTDGIRRYEGGRFVVPGGTGSLRGRRAVPEAEDDRGRIWIATRQGAATWQDGEVRRWAADQGLVDGWVRGIAVDGDGTVWIGTFAQGLHQLVTDAFSVVDEPRGLPANVVLSFARDREGRLWVGTVRGAAVLADGRARPVAEFDGQLVISMTKGPDGRLWYATTEGLVRRSGTGFRRFGAGDGVPHSRVYAVVPGGRGQLWVGTAAGVARVGPGGEPGRVPGDSVLRGENVTDFAPGPAGRTWIATDAGLFVHEGERISRALDRASGHGVGIIDLLLDDAGDLWLATQGEGVLRYRPGEGIVDRIDAADGLPSEHVVLLEVDDRDQLWIGTNRGLSRLRLDRYREAGATDLRHYGIDDGFFGGEAVQTASLVDRDGTLWFGSVEGAVHYFPGRDREREPPPRTLVTGVSRRTTGAPAREADAGVEAGERLGPGTGALVFEYVGIEFQSPGEVEYRYRLRGHDEGWSPVTRHTSVTYTNLPAGDYEFEVQARTGDGPWSAAAGGFRFALAPPFWRTWWFLVLSGLLLAALAYGIHAFRLRRLEAQRDRLEALVEKRTRELREANERLKAANESLERLARHDSLTGIANRRSFDHRLEREWARARRERSRLSLALVDIDQFKPYNDAHGHQAGDECLRAVAEVLTRANRRPADLAARVGGEEFAVLMPDTGLEGAREVAQRIADKVRGLEIDQAPEVPTSYLTVSIGVASARPEGALDPEELYGAADEALYRAKQQGRDRIVAGPELSAAG